MWVIVGSTVPDARMAVTSLVSYCFYRTHQVLVDLKGCELQGQLHWLSVRVREGGNLQEQSGIWPVGTS